MVKKAARAGALLAGSLMLLSVIGAVAFRFTERLFHGQEVLLVCFVIALGTYAVQHITRGTLSGNGRFGPYGMILGAEGVFRILPVIVVYAAGIDNLLWYGLALAIPPLLASLVAVRGEHGLLAPGPEAEWSELSTNLTLLFLGSLAAQALSYAAALGVIVLAQGKHERNEAADFIVGFFIARIPILLFQAIQAALLPKLAALAGAGKHDDFRSGLKKLVMIVVGVGVLGIVAGATIGPTVGQILFGDKFNLSHQDLTLLVRRERGVHPRPHPRPGPDRAARPRACAHRVDGRPRDLRRRDGLGEPAPATTSSSGPSSATSPAVSPPRS